MTPPLLIVSLLAGQPLPPLGPLDCLRREKCPPEPIVEKRRPVESLLPPSNRLADLYPHVPGVIRVWITSPNPGIELRQPLARLSTPEKVTLVESTVCRAPCGVLVDARSGEEFLLSADGVTDSARFRLFDRKGDVTIKASPGRTPVRAAGGALASLGIIGSLPGIYSLAVYGAGCKECWGISGGAVATAVLGFVLIYFGRTTFEIVPGPGA